MVAAQQEMSKSNQRVHGFCIRTVDIHMYYYTYTSINETVSLHRHLEHSTIIYEDPQHSPLLRLSWNKQDPNYLATFSLDAMEVCTDLCCLEPVQ